MKPTRRYKYGINRQMFNTSLFGKLVPLGYLPVSPGETYTGKIDVHLKSDQTVGQLLNRAYTDLYAFYCPYRLLDEDFPAFIAEGTGSVPTVTAAFESNFEKPPAAHSAWKRYMYNTVWNKFFRRASQSEVALTDMNVLDVSMRQTNFHLAVPEGPTYTSPNLGTTVQDFRQALSQERFDQARQYYGDRYVDYLRALGVEAGWTVLEEPELLGKINKPLTYRVIDPTGNVDSAGTQDYPSGRSGGYWEQQITLPIQKSFLPEHGLIGIYGTVLLDDSRSNYQDPIDYMPDPEHYWSPERDTNANQDWPDIIWNPTGTGTVTMPMFEHLRKPASLNSRGRNANTAYGPYYFIQETNSVPIADQPEQGDISAIFQEVIGTLPDDSTAAQMAWSAVYKMQKVSPVPKLLNQTPLR